MDDLADLSVVFGANIDQVTSAGAMVGDIFTAIAENAAVSGADISESMTMAAESLSAISEAGTEISTGIEEGVAGGTDALSTIPAAADEAASQSQSAFSGFDLGGMVNQVSMGIFNLQNLGNTASQLAGSLLDPAAAAETVDSALTTLLGSSKAASDELSQLDSFASKTPFKTMDIDQAAEQLIGFKTKASDVIPDIKAIGDALGAVGRDTPAELNSVVDIFGKMQVTGKVTQATITELGVHGIDALGAIALGAGKSQEQIQAMIKHGTLPATDAVNDLTKGIEANPMLSGGMARSAGTFTGLMSTLKSNWDQLLVSFGSPIINALESHMNDLGNALASPGFKTFAGDIGQGLVTVFTDIGNSVHYVEGVLSTVYLGDFREAWKAVSLELQATTRWFDVLHTSVQPIFTDFDPIANVIQKLAEGGMSMLNNLLWDMSGAWLEVYKNVKGTTSPLTGVATLFEQIGPAIGQVVGVFQSQFAPALENIAKIMGGQFMQTLRDVGIAAEQMGKWFLTSVVPAFQQAMPGFETLGKVMLTTVIPAFLQIREVGMQFIEHVVKELGPPIEKIIPPLIVFAGVMAGDIAQAITFLAPIIVNIAQQVEIFASGLIDRLMPIATEVFGWIAARVKDFQAFWNLAWPGIELVLEGAWNMISGIVEVAWSLVSGIINIGLDVLSGNWSQAWKDIQTMLSGVWDGIGKFLTGAVQAIVGILYTAGAAILAALTKPFNDAWNTISGVFTNIKNVIGNIGGDVTGALHSAHIPGFASGTSSAPGGLSLVGENGPELVMLNRGASVIPLNTGSSSSILSSSFAGGGGEIHVHNHIYMDGQEITNKVMTRAVKMIRQQGGKMVNI